MNDLEARLRSWVPRRPSASLEKRLFGRRPAGAVPPPGFRLNWLAPATAAVLLAGLFLSQHYNAHIGSSNAGPIVAMILSNQSAAAYLPGSFPRAQNRLPADAYQWTIRAGATSVINAVFDSKRIR
ncbi:MAG: hypothetical protein ABSF95_08150 [Verrucomicrobiota bacterium]